MECDNGPGLLTGTMSRPNDGLVVPINWALVQLEYFLGHHQSPVSIFSGPSSGG